MGAIQKITDRFSIKVQPQREEVATGRCPCGSSEFWLPVGSLPVPKCQTCSPPPLARMKAMDLVADDHGGWWKPIEADGELASLVKLDKNFRPVYEIR